MESEELNLTQLFKNLYKRKEILFKILAIAMIFALLYVIAVDILIRDTTAEVLIDKADTSIVDLVSGLNTSNVKIEFDKTKKIISFTTSGIDAVDSQINVEKQINLVENKLIELYQIETYQIVKEVNTETISYTKIIKDIAIFEVVGLVVYCAYVFLITSWQATTDEYSIYKITGLKVLGKFDKGQELSLEDQLKIIKTNIELNKENKEPKTIIISGAKNEVGTTYIVNTLAESYATENKKVAVITKEGKTKNKNISLINLENKNFSKEELVNKLNDLKEKNDLILIDGNIIKDNYKSIIFASIADSNIIVALAEKTKMEDIIKSKQYIEDVNGKISGIILNNI